MLTLEDCIQMSELTEEEIAAITEHERLPVLAAAELGNHLLHSTAGPRRIAYMIEDSVVAARSKGDAVRIAKLQRVLRQFRRKHASSLR
jgi:hypothetical protein